MLLFETLGVELLVAKAPHWFGQNNSKDDVFMRAARKQEDQKTWFRSERVFLTEGDWYFHTREGVDLGPYPSQFEAEIEAGMLKELLKTTDRGEPALSVIREFVLASYAIGRPLAPNFSRALVALQKK